jgi:hypothetical protein
MMRGNALRVCCFVALLFGSAARPAPAQEEVYHPGETYDSLQAGRDAYWDAEAQRRALTGRQLLIEGQIMRQNTWANPQDKYRPVHPESYGPILPRAYAGPTLADVYAYPQAGPVYYGGTAAPVPSSDGVRTPIAANHRNAYSAPVPVFEPWPDVPNDIWAAPYYGYVRQPIGHMKIWTSRLGYIYKPIYASPPLVTARAASPRAAAPPPRRPLAEPGARAGGATSPTGSLNSPPPPPRPAVPSSPPPDAKPGEGHDLNPPKTGQEL